MSKMFIGTAWDVICNPWFCCLWLLLSPQPHPRVIFTTCYMQHRNLL